MSYTTPGAGSAGHQTRRGGNQNVYQIDFTAVASGKRIANTKRRVRWRFGFTNVEALENGETGTACRGEEHDITLVWSVTSGKRLVLADGQEVHYSNSRGNTFEFSWTMRGNHVLKMIAHASAPISATNTFRQYDFYINGQSFFTFPKVYRLGLSSRDARNVNSNQIVSVADRSDTYRNYEMDGGGVDNATGIGNTSAAGGNKNNIAAIEAPHNESEEEAYLAEAIKNSLQDVPTKTPTSSIASSTAQPAPQPFTPAALPPAPAPAPDADLLLDFFDGPPSTPAAPLALPPSNPAPPAQYNYAPAPVTATALPIGAPPVAQPDPTRSSFANQPPPQQYQPTPFHAPPATHCQPTPAPYMQPVAPSDPFGPAPSASFTQPPAPTPFAPPSVPPAAPPAVDPFAPNTQPPVSDPFNPVPPQAISNPLNLYSNAPAVNGNAPLSFNTPSQPDGKLSGANADQAYSNLINGFSLEISTKKNPATENPFDAYSSGPQPTLGSLQTNKPKTSKKEVMAPSAAMVVSNAQSGNWSGYGNPQAGQYNQQQPGGNNYPQYQQSFTGPPPGYPQYQQPPPPQPPQQPNQYQNYQQQSMQNGNGNR